MSAHIRNVFIAFLFTAVAATGIHAQVIAIKGASVYTEPGTLRADTDKTRCPVSSETIANVAVAWALARPQVGAAILGARTADHGRSNVRALTLGLTAAESARIDAVLADHPGPSGDAFGLERVPGGPHARIMKTDLNRVGDEGGAR